MCEIPAAEYTELVRKAVALDMVNKLVHSYLADDKIVTAIKIMLEEDAE